MEKNELSNFLTEKTISGEEEQRQQQSQHNVMIKMAAFRQSVKLLLLR